MGDVKFPDVEVFRVERMNLSRNGNPRFKLHTSKGTFHTGVDYGIAYGLENYTNSRFSDTHVIGNEGVKVTLIGDSGRNGLARPENRIKAIEHNGKVLS